jgi:hypothetical protein
LIASLVLIAGLGTCLSDSSAFSDTGIDAYPAVFPAVLDSRAAKRPVRTLLQKID